MDIDEYAHGAPCWADVVCPDMDAAAAFYGGLLGWTVPEGAPEFGGYRNATIGDRVVAGMVPPMDPSMITVWSVYIKTDDAEATSAAVTANGGQVMVPPMPVGDLGVMAIYIDPTGAVIGAWQPGLHGGAGVYAQHGAPCWAELITSDVDSAKAFYSAVFGWEWGGGDGYHEFSAAGQAVGGVMPTPPHMPDGVPNHWSIYYTVDDLDAALAATVELGGAVCVGATTIAPGRFAVVSDPNGAMFNVIQFAEAS
jgi:uncharacterized protein